METPDLKPCPFCRKYAYFKPNPFFMMLQLKCAGCGVSMVRGGITSEAKLRAAEKWLAAKWNRRTPEVKP